MQEQRGLGSEWRGRDRRGTPGEVGIGGNTTSVTSVTGTYGVFRGRSKCREVKRDMCKVQDPKEKGKLLVRAPERSRWGPTVDAANYTRKRTEYMALSTAYCYVFRWRYSVLGGYLHSLSSE